MTSTAPKQTIYRLNKTENSCRLQYSTLQNEDLSSHAYRVHTTYLSKSSTWNVNRAAVAKLLKVSIRTAQNVMNELKQAGLVEYKKTGPRTGYYVFYEFPKKEMKAILNQKAANEEPENSKPDQVAEKENPPPAQVIPTKEEEKETVYARCITRLKKVFNGLSSDELVYLELAYSNFVDTLTTKIIRQDMAFNWLYNGLQGRRRTGYRLLKINAEKDKKADAVVNIIRAQTANLEAKTPKTTEQRLNNTDWAEGL